MQIQKSMKGLCAGMIVLAVLGPVPAAAATYTVTSTADSGTGTLRAALLLATSGSDTINFSLTLPATITLTSDELHLNAPVTITGPGASSLTISGGGRYRVFESDAQSVSISGLTIANGAGAGATSYPNLGGGIYNGLGTMTLTGVTLTSNSAQEGGAIYNNGPMTVANCTISGNKAATGTGAGAFTGEGGGIFNYGTLTVSGSAISNNTASDNGVSGSAANGGGIVNAYIGLNTTGVLIVSNSTISGNSAPFEGGGIENNNGTMTIANSTISGNNSLGNGSYNGQGGGIENFGAGAISASTISGNASGGSSGGIDNQAPLTIANSTISGNSAGYNGGGIESGGTGAMLSLSFVTISGNRSNTVGFSFTGDGLVNYGTAILKNSILANSSAAGGNCYVFAGYPAITSQGYNLSDDTSCTTYFNQTSDIDDTPAGLGAGGLQNNGGPTQTIALLSGSPAIDAIPVSPFNYCTDLSGNPVATDQRGVTRPQGAACDMGAFELAQLPGQTIAFGPLTSQVLGAPPFTVSATATSGLTVSFNSQTPSVCTASGTNGSTVTLIAAGTCTIQATQGGSAGYAPATPVSQSFQVTSVTLTSQTITFGALANQPISTTTFSVSATATSGLTVSFNSQTTSFCTVSGTTVTLAAIGTCTIQATQAGNAVYAAASPVSQSFQVTLVSQTIAFAPLPNLPLSSATFTLTATATSGLTVTFSSATSGVCTVSVATVTLVGAGLCTIQAAQAGNIIYWAPATPVNQSFEVELTPLSYGTAARVTQHDRFPGDFLDITTGDFGQLTQGINAEIYTGVAIQIAYPRIVAIDAANPAGLATGAWSYPATAEGSARGIAFRNFLNQTSAPITLRLNGILNGQFNVAPFQLPNGPAYIGAAIHVFDGSTFINAVRASGKTAGQFLLDGYSFATSLSPPSVIGNLNSVFPGMSLAPSGAVYMANCNCEPYTPEPYATPISARVTTGTFTVAPGQIVTVVFDVATATIPVQTGDTLAGGKIGGSSVYFLDTLQPAANFFTDANGNPVTGLTALDAPLPTSFPPALGALSLTPATGTNLVGNTATVTATATDTIGNPLANAIVKFTVVSGPNDGTVGAGVTGANGQTTFSYSGTGGAGADIVEAAIGTLVSNMVQQTWTLAPLPSGSACNGTYDGTFKGNLTISTGQNCVLVGGTVTGNIRQTGGSLTLSNFIVEGNVDVQGGGTIVVGPNAVIDGNLQIQDVPAGAAPSQICRANVKGNLQFQNNGTAVQIGSASPSCAGNIIDGNLQVQSNSGTTAIVGNTVSGNVQDQSNTAATQVSDNTISGNLQCQSNSSITGGGNTASGQKQGQCAAF